MQKGVIGVKIFVTKTNYSEAKTMNAFFKAYCRVYQAAFRVAMKVMNFRQPQIIDGLDNLMTAIKDENVNSLLIVTDNWINNIGKLTDNLKAKLTENGISYVVYDGVIPNPDVTNIEDAFKLYNENGCQAIIAFGGGSHMDCAKGVACRVAHPNKTIAQMAGTLKVRKKLVPFFAIPTTSGTGSEATVAAIISNRAEHTKYPVQDPCLIPKYAVLDPFNTATVPAHLTAWQGMDALTHAVEAYIGKSNTDLTRDLSVRATKLIFENLVAVYNDAVKYSADGPLTIDKVKDDKAYIKRRKNMQWASYYAGVAFTRAYVGYAHSLAHAIGGMYPKTQHGLANAVLLPYVLDYYGSAAYTPLAELANAIGITGPSDESKAKQFIKAIRDLNERMNIPTQLPVEGYDESTIPEMVEHSFKEANPLYPVPKFMDKETMTEIYKKILIAK